MMMVFEVYLAAGVDPDGLLTSETIGDTGAQVMTLEEARAVGFSSLPEPGDKVVRFIAVAERDARRIQRVLETNHIVSRFRVHEVA